MKDQPSVIDVFNFNAHFILAYTFFVSGSCSVSSSVNYGHSLWPVDHKFATSKQGADPWSVTIGGYYSFAVGGFECTFRLATSRAKLFDLSIYLRCNYHRLNYQGHFVTHFNCCLLAGYGRVDFACI